MAHSIPLLEISGTPRERGLIHGKTFSGRIKVLLSRYIKSLEQKSIINGVTPLTKLKALKISDAYIKPTEEYAPDLLEEVKGIAEGAGVPFEDLFLLNAFIELSDYLYPAFVESGCTSIMVPGNLKGNDAIIAQSYDLASFFEPAAVLLKITEVDKPDVLIYTSAGIIGGAGLNSMGIGVVVNNLTASDACKGVPFPFVLRKTLSAKRIGAAIGSVITASRASGMNYILCDSFGEIYNIETTAKKYDVSFPLDTPMVHTNHYLSSELKTFERRKLQNIAESIARLGRATRILLHLDKPHSEFVRRVLEDHVNSPIGICRHDVLTGKDRDGRTVCGIIFEPAERRAWFTHGPPCQNEWVEYNI